MPKINNNMSLKEIALELLDAYSGAEFWIIQETSYSWKDDVDELSAEVRRIASIIEEVGKCSGNPCTK